MALDASLGLGRAIAHGPHVDKPALPLDTSGVPGESSPSLI